MFTSCILFSTLTAKTKGMSEGASKRTTDLRILPLRDRAPGFEIPGSATVVSIKKGKLNYG